MAPLGSSSQLQRYYPILFTGAALCLAFITYQVYQSNTESNTRKLHRSNATRRNRNSRRPAATGGANDSSSATANGTGLDDNTGRPNGSNAANLPFNDADSSDDDFAGMDPASVGGTALSAEDKQNQNLLNLLYHIAEVGLSGISITQF